VVQIPDGEILLFCRRFRPVLGPTQPHIQWVPGLKRPGRLVDLSPLVQRLRMSGAISPLLLYTSMGWIETSLTYLIIYLLHEAKSFLIN
jgi:hypothetical protein